MVRAIAEALPPGEYIKDEIEARGWTLHDLTSVLGGSEPDLRALIDGQLAMTTQTAEELAAAFETSVEVWLNLETRWRLWRNRLLVDIVEDGDLEASSVRPPAAPWSPLLFNQPATGYLSVYLADDLSRLPVRHVTRPHDNKSDPNIETGTYGLFSTCEHQMRAGIVNRGARYIIFVCRQHGRRVIPGYYRLAWKTEGALQTKGADYVLGADLVHFVDPPIPIADFPEPAASAAGTGFRLSKRVDSPQTEALIATLDERPNAISDYLSEIDRLERFQAFHSGGYRYVSWQQREPFSWSVARRYLEPSTSVDAVPNQSNTGFWQCTDEDCGQFVRNQALLKMCPFCGAMGTLQPVTDPTNASLKE